MGLCVDAFRGRIDFDVSNTLPEPVPFGTRVRGAVDDFAGFFASEADRAVVDKVLGHIAEAEVIKHAHNFPPISFLWKNRNTPLYVLVLFY